MKFTLIICTYQRPESLRRLLNSIQEQILYPDEILVVDSSPDLKTEELLLQSDYKNVQYHKVEDKDRGLTRQRNYGIKKAQKSSEILCFLDDDIVLTAGYFKTLIETFDIYPEAVGVGGSIINEGVWKKSDVLKAKRYEYYYSKGWERKLGSRNVLRKRLGLLSTEPPGVMPSFSHGLTIGFFPPTAEVHRVEYFMGGVSAFRRELFEKVKFSEYFLGYGLYEDMDFCLRASQIGLLYLNTGAKVFHLHEESGRPDAFRYGKMVVENGWIVWKLKNPAPGLKDIVKWNIIILVLAAIRMKNGIFDRENGAMKDAMGRYYAWVKLCFIKPKRENFREEQGI